MIQRIQSVYLLLAGIALAISCCTPLVTFGQEGKSVATMFATTINGQDGAALSHPWGVITFGVVGILLALTAIFAYKNRLRQIKIVNIFLLVVLLLYVTMMAYGYAFNASHNTTLGGAWGAVLPFVAYVFGWLARRAIRKDENLVRAAERFR